MKPSIFLPIFAALAADSNLTEELSEFTVTVFSVPSYDRFSSWILTNSRTSFFLSGFLLSIFSVPFSDPYSSAVFILE